MNLTLLTVGETPARLRDRLDRYPPYFQNMFAAAGCEFTFDQVLVLDGEPLPAPDAPEGIVITGSAFGVYDETEWMEPLRAFIRAAYATGTPMLGVCFGHQVMADALGGNVGKAPAGWGIGRHTYRLIDPPQALGLEQETLSIACSHKDQVRSPPPVARVFMASNFTPNAGLVYENGRAISVQPHPEFDRTIAEGLCELRRDNPLSDAAVDAALAGLAEPVDSLALARGLGRFLIAARR
ncbi:type 1 glutamine amidotransferase [Pelagibacterium montanilacus]|uniref:type 1 glutamine amidotransferase n=1 Tax=Pelagibacterium montanilacus TaxID=2185280 RepID=UPI0013E0D1CB|nr:type 1 glutamine amidotransferase [Pelagibacterium montanilacus]